MGYQIVFNSKEVLTRKPHVCWGCAEHFPIKSRLIKVDGIDDNSLAYTIYWCRLCYGFLETLADNDGIAFGEFKSEYEYKDFINNSLKGKLIKLT